MKKIEQNAIKKSYRQKILATSIAAIYTSLVASSVAQASDIDIYQTAKEGDITLMFMLDISGSMGAPQLIKSASACDLPSITGAYDAGSVLSTNGNPKYTRYYCTATKDVYFYRSTGSGSSLKYFKCGTNGTTTATNTTCSTEIAALPDDARDMTTSTSGSATNYYKKKESDKYYDRITRLKDGMFDLLNGNATKGIGALDDAKVIGLSTYSRPTSFDSQDRPNTADNTRGQVRIPARALGDMVDGVKQRQILLNEIATLGARGGTPTSHAYAETAAYLFGTRTGTRTSALLGASTTSNPSRFFECTDKTATGGCNSYSATYTSLPSYDYRGLSNNYYYYYKNNAADSDSGNSGFPYSYADTKTADGSLYSSPASLIQTDAAKQCSGQGIYVLTDGEPSSNGSAESLMRAALDTKSSALASCTSSETSWDCTHKFAGNLIDAAKNPLNLKIKTAVVGFGNSFNSVTSFDKAKTQAQNIAALGTIDWSEGKDNVQKAAYWGIIGEGGWYSGNSSEDIVKSVNSFLGDLGGAIPSVTTGSPSVPQDALNPSVIQDFAYYSQFQPTPEKSFQLWAGNLKKYAVIDGVLKDKNKNTILDNDGAIKDNYDLWATSVVDANKEGNEFTEGSTKFALRGGVFSQLKLGFSASDNIKEQRKVLTNRDVSLGVWGGGTNLRQVTRADLTNSTYKADNANNSYLMALLGYNVNDLSNPTSTTLNKELRQIGAVMHSSPLLITNKGKIAYDKDVKRLSSEGREDYILFGTTQGVLHVVKAGKQRLENGDIVVGDKNGSGSSDAGGDEVFTFVPNEMIEKQKYAFLKYDSTNGGVNNLYYGIDGPWTVYTEYVVDDNGYLTVGSGKGTQKGRQMVYGGLRMGGNSYYALDLQNMNDPKLKFHIDPEKQKVFYNNSSKSFNQLQYMGQSWSKPTIGWINWKDSAGKTTRKQVMFVGGGYDAKTDTTACNTGTDTGVKTVGYECEKFAPSTSAPAKGAGVYMFDAQNGDLLWWSGASATTSTTVPLATKVSNMYHSVVSEIRTVDRDGDDLIDNIYFGDLGGQVFRVDFNNKASTLGTIVKNPVRLLNLNKTGGMSPRFYDMPAFSLYSDQGTVFALISIGSGNRSKPLQDYTSGTADYDAVYNIYDKDVAKKNLMSLSTYSTKDIIKNELAIITDTDTKDDTTLKAPYATSKGWYYEYKNCSGSAPCSNYKAQSEKVFGTPIAMNYVLYVTTFDGSRPGISGDCGAGVKGESYLSRLCLPYGQCDKTKFGTEWYSKDEIGVGIHTGTVIGMNDGSGSGTGGGSGGVSGSGTGGSENNYCLSTGTRTIYNGMGGNTGEASKICLIPQRWYAKLQ